MLIIKLLVNEKLSNAEFVLNQSGSDKIIENCEKYLFLLSEYGDDLQTFRGTQGINLHPSSALIKELVEQTRKIIGIEEENINRKRFQMQALLKSFTTITATEAVKTLNHFDYKGFNKWELRANEIRLKNDSNGEKFTVMEAIKIASELRRKAFAIYKTTFID